MTVANLLGIPNGHFLQLETKFVPLFAKKGRSISLLNWTTQYTFSHVRSFHLTVDVIPFQSILYVITYGQIDSYQLFM